MDIETRLWKKVQKTDDCWLWIAALDTDGYGQFPILGLPRKAAHKVVYELLVGKVPKGRQIDHLCRNRACVNPAHMEIVSSRENTLRGISPPAKNAIKMFCINGHSLSEENIYQKPLKKFGWRQCKKCNLAITRRKYEAYKHKSSPTSLV